MEKDIDINLGEFGEEEINEDLINPKEVEDGDDSTEYSRYL